MKFFKPIDNKKAIYYDPSGPYIHWGKPTSVGLYNCIHIFFEAPENNGLDIYVSIEDSDDVFYVLNDYRASKGEDLIECLDKTSELSSFRFIPGNDSDEESIQSGSFYHAIIVYKSDVEGEFITNVKITPSIGKPVTIRVGAEFYAENESLRINLANNGIELPEDICKALYPADPEEEKPDWILLNRKFKELLAHHIEVADNKGSYKSLLNALQWFEYRDLVRLREVWKYNTPDGTKYYDVDLERIVNEDTELRMFNSSKTTSYILDSLKYVIGKHGSNPTPQITPVEYGHQDYFDSDVAQAAMTKWTEAELKFKMMALGYFFETYFMPIHTELERSVVEDNGTFEVIHTKSFTGTTGLVFTESRTARFNLNLLEADGVTVNDSATYQLGEAHVYAGIDTPDTYGRAFETIETTQQSRMFWTPIIGCHTTNEANTAGVNLNEWNGQMYSGLGTVVTMRFAFGAPIVSGELITDQLGTPVVAKFTVPAGQARNSFSSKLLFPKPGKFKLCFKFTATNGTVFEQTKEITIEDTLYPELKYYGLVACVRPGFETPNPWETQYSADFVSTRDVDEEYTLREGVGEEIGLFYADLLRNRGAIVQSIAMNTNGTDKLHWEVPYVTPVNTITWTGANAEASMNAALRTLESGHWCATSVDTNKARIRYCNKIRGRGNVVPAGVTDNQLVTTDVFFPELHRLIPIKDKIGQDTPIVVRPEVTITTTELENGVPKQVKKALPYSEAIDETAWEFYSCGQLKNIGEFDRNIMEPILAPNENTLPPPGFYRITFRYSTVFGETRTIVANPSWRVVPEHIEMSS